MDKKIQELTQKIYAEGIEKAQAEANEIIAQAQAKAQEIEQAAQKAAEKLAAATQKEMDDLRTNTHSEIKMYGQQSVEALKSEVATLITNQVAESSIELAMSDKEFMQQVILALAAEWGKRESVVIETEDATILTNYFEVKAKELLNNGLTIKQVNGMQTSFAVMPADESYRITFGEEEFSNYFKAFLRPKLVELLFSKEA